MVSDMIEQVAKAIFASDMKWAPVLEHQFEENRAAYLSAARAAIEAHERGKQDARAQLWARLVNHYWDSLEADKMLVLKHVKAVLDYDAEMETIGVPISGEWDFDGKRWKRI